MKCDLISRARGLWPALAIYEAILRLTASEAVGPAAATLEGSIFADIGNTF